MLHKIKIQYDELKERIQTIQDKNSKLSEINKNVEERLSNNKYLINSLKNQVREKDKEILDCKEKLLLLENFRHEKEKSEKIMSNNSKTIHSFREKIDRKIKNLKN